MELCGKIVACIQPLTIFAKNFILGVSQDYEYAFDKVKQNPGVVPWSETLLIANSIHVSLISN